MKIKTLERSTLKFTYFDVKRWLLPQLIGSILVLIVIHPVYPHGTVTSPPSRIWNCFQENPENPDSPPCIDAVASHGTQPMYDWNEINQANANGDHMLYVMNGNLASGGRPEKYGGMDQVRSDWVATPVSPGPFTVTWTNSAPHATAYYDVYITNEGWSPDQPLTWNDLTLLVRTPPSAAASSVDIAVDLPVRTGKHVIYSVWQRSDSPEAFYSTSDIDFGETLSIEDNEEASALFDLKQNYPNPFRSISKIGYSLGKEAFVTLKVYDLFGKEIATLIDGIQTPGDYEVSFNAENLSSGMYFYVFRAGNFTDAKRMLLLQ